MGNPWEIIGKSIETQWAPIGNQRGILGSHCDFIGKQRERHWEAVGKQSEAWKLSGPHWKIFEKLWRNHWNATGKLIFGAKEYRKDEIMRFVPKL